MAPASSTIGQYGPAHPHTTMDSWIRQRAVARRLPAIMDCFTEHLAAGEVGHRLEKPVGRTGEATGILRNVMRIYALGFAVRLGLDLGLPMTALHGKSDRGRTEILDLLPFLGGSVVQALANFDALRADRGEIGRLVDARYAVVLRSAQEEVAECEAAVVTAQREAVKLDKDPRGRPLGSKNKAKSQT